MGRTFLVLRKCYPYKCVCGDLVNIQSGNSYTGLVTVVQAKYVVMVPRPTISRSTLTTCLYLGYKDHCTGKCKPGRNVPYIIHMFAFLVG